MLPRISALLLNILLLSNLSECSAQNPAPPRAGGAEGRVQLQGDGRDPRAVAPPLAPEMEQLLRAWASRSAQIKRLEGQHLRRVYDSVFEVEKLSEGHFWYEAPDKGRIDVVPTKITQEMLDERNLPDAKVRRRKEDGKPFNLLPGQPEKWICDGVRVFEIDDEKKSAQVGQLPPDMQGTSIMNSPLPFLFGMPPEKARVRFQLSFTKPFDPASGYAHITALPLMEQDARSWSQADVILNLQTFLPVAIQLKDPPGTGTTVYIFKELEPNKPGWTRKPTEWLVDFFKPDLRDYNVVMIDAGPGQQLRSPGIAQAPGGNAKPGPLAPVIPDFTGMPYEKAVEALKPLGLTRDNKRVLILRGTPATSPGNAFRVQDQAPAAGTPVGEQTIVTLKLWDKVAN